MSRLLLLFTLVPFVELYLLLAFADATGLGATLGMILATGVVGAALAKREGLRVLHQYQGALARGVMPEAGVVEALLVLVGGVLLVAPGVLTDVVGLLLLVPFTRRLLLPVVRRRIERAVARGTVRVSGFGFSGSGASRGAGADGGAHDGGRGWERLDARVQKPESDADVV